MSSGRAPSLDDLTALAERAFARLPAQFRRAAGDVTIHVHDFADDETLDAMGIEDPFELTGLYSGRPIGEPAATGDPPPTIHLYRRPLLDEWCDTGVGLERLITHVVVHEIGHHFGLSDDDMHRLEEAG